jgi:uncharacterized repeat protein (TIGR01451 family)
MSKTHILSNNLLVESNLILNPEIFGTLEQAFLLLQNQLRIFANDTKFSQNMALAFGEGITTDPLQTAWLAVNVSNFPQIEIVSGTEINTAKGAYAGATNRIYLSLEFLSINVTNPEVIASILLEEYGHRVDTVLNSSDAPGDEGAIFSALAQGKVLSNERLQQLKTEDDITTINIDGQVIQIEQASTGWISGEFEGSQKTLKLDSKGGGIVQYSYQMYGIPDNLILRYEGKDILNTGYVSGDKTGTVQIPKGNSDELQVILATNDAGTAWDYIVETINNGVNIKDAYIAVEGGSSKTATIKFPVTLSKASNVATTVQYVTLLGTAVDGKTGKDRIDYQPVKGTVTFAPGETTKNIEITVFGDRSVNYANDKNFEIFARDTAYRDWNGKEGQDIDEKLTDKDGNILISPYGDLGYRVNKIFDDSSTDFQAVGLTSDEKFFVLISDPTNAEISKDGDAEKNRLLTELAKDFGGDKSSPAYQEAEKQINKQIDDLQAQKASWTFATGTIFDKGKPPVLALRGTASFRDVWSDANLLGIGYDQFQAAKNLGVDGWLKDVSKPKDTDVSFKPDLTGHSLGGALTQWVAADYSSQGALGDIVTFNSPGISIAGADSFKGAEKVTHYVTSSDVVSMAGTKYIPGQYVLSNYLSGINVAFEHTHPVIIPKTYRTGDEKPPSLLLEAPASSTKLSSPLFTYLPDPDYFAFQLVVAGAGNLVIPGLGSYLAKELTFRRTTEANRKLIGAVIYGGGAIWNGIVVTADAINFGIEFAKESIQSAWNASKKWLPVAWNAVTQWREDAWSGITNWTSTTWNATINFTKDAWNATKNWGIDQWDGINKWTATAWNATKNWGSDQWNATIHWGSDAWNATASWTSDKWNATTRWTASAWDATTHWLGNLLPFASNSFAVTAVPQAQSTQISSPWEAISHWSPEAWQATTHWSDAAWQATTQWTLDTWQATTQWSDETWKSTTQWTDDIWQATAKFDGIAGDQFVFGTIGNDNLSGGFGNDILNGLDGNDTLDGQDGNDIIQGGSGNDTLIGGTGNDNFVFNSPTDGVDTITDFENGGIDRIVISAKGFGAGLTPDDFLQQSQFVLGTMAADGDDRFIYDPATGNLFFDPDGTGNLPQQQIAKLTGAPNLSAYDIFISGNSTTPTLQITAPDADVSGKEVTIQWNAFDADSEAKISLFYDTDNQGFDGVLIADGLTETDGEGSFVWNTENVSKGDYFIYGKIVDENNSSVFSYSKGQVKLESLTVADLSVTQTASDTSVVLGDNLTYTIQVTNNSLVTSQGVTLVETLPEEVTFVSASLNPSQQTDNILTFDVGDLAAGESKIVTVNVVAPTTAGKITSSATVSSNTLDSNKINDTAVLSIDAISPALPDLTVVRTNQPETLEVGDTYTYTLTVSNIGTADATGVVLKENLPSGVNFVNSTTPVSFFNDTVTANLGNLKTGESKTFNLTVKSFVAGKLIGTSNVTSNEVDLNPLNNLVVSRTTVSPTLPANADLELTQTVSKTDPVIGDRITFTLKLSNKGPGIASGIEVSDLLPKGLKFVSALPEQGTYNSNTGIWDVGNVRDNLSRTLQITADVVQGGKLLNTAQIIAVNENDPDSVPGNNSPTEDDQATITLTVPGAANEINGTSGRDNLVGSTLNEIITGFQGGDSLTGGSGNDQFVYTSIRDRGDTITDFEISKDSIILTQLLDSLITGGYNGTNAIADGYVKVVQGNSASKFSVQIDTDGLATGDIFRPFITVNLTNPGILNSPSNFVF